MFSSTKCFNKTKSLQNGELCYLCNDYESPYDTLIAKSGKVSIKVSRLRSFCVEICKSINSVNSSFMNEIFRLRVTNRVVRSQYRLNINILKVNQVTLVIRAYDILYQKF